MTAAHKNFDDEAEVQAPSCTFTLAGRTWTCKAATALPWNAKQTVFALKDGDDDTLLIQVEPFFRTVLVADDVEPFMTMLNDPQSAVTEAKLQPLMDFVFEQVFGRPTEPSANSSPGRSGRGRSSKAASSSPDTPRLASAG